MFISRNSIIVGILVAGAGLTALMLGAGVIIGVLVAGVGVVIVVLVAGAGAGAGLAVAIIFAGLGVLLLVLSVLGVSSSVLGFSGLGGEQQVILLLLLTECVEGGPTDTPLALRASLALK